MSDPEPRYEKGDKIGGRYLVHQALMGGFGEVYLCLDLEQNYPVALNTMQRPGRPQDPPAVREGGRNLGSA